PMKPIAFALAALLMSARLAAASERLGDSGTTVLSGQLALNATNYGAAPGGWSFALAPGADVVVHHGVTLGAALDLDLNFSDEIWGGGVGLTPRVGYIVPLASRVALWPRGAVGFLHRFAHGGVSSLGPQMDFALNAFSVTAEAPLTVEIVSHMFLSFGPY